MLLIACGALLALSGAWCLCIMHCFSLVTQFVLAELLGKPVNGSCTICLSMQARMGMIACRP